VESNFVIGNAIKILYEAKCSVKIIDVIQHNKTPIKDKEF